MTESNPRPSGEAGESRMRWALLAPAVLAIVPYLLFHGLFARLFWFGDDIDQVHLIDSLGFWRWLWIFYGENFVPLFKLCWGSCLFLFHGSYGAMIAVVWLNHALNVALFGRLMRVAGLSWTATLLAQVVLGLTPATIETLAFSVEWAVVLSLTFMLLALLGAFRSTVTWAPMAWALASALSFVKGVLTGPLVALACLRPAGSGPSGHRLGRAGYAALFLLPSVLVGLLVALFAQGNHRHMAGHGAEAALYGTWYYCLNPFFSLFSLTSWGWRTVAALGLVKIAMIAWAILRSQGNQRRLFVVLAAFDVANAVLLGIGRYNFGLRTAVSSRYQYASLIGILPIAAFCLCCIWERLPVAPVVRRMLPPLGLAIIAVILCQQWRAEIEQWSGWRGTEPRRILLVEPAPGPYSVPGYPGFPTQRARDLIARYNLH